MLDAILAQSRNTALIMGLIAMIGLLLQKKHATDVISGTMKTVIGFMVFNIGSSAMSGVVQTFTDLFNVAFGIEGVTTQVEVATGLALNTYGTEVALVMLLGFVVNLIVAKFTRFKAIFLTGQHFLYFACVIALIFIANGLPMPLTVIAGGILLGFCGAALPSFCQPFMNKITGADNLAMGHFNCIGYAFSVAVIACVVNGHMDIVLEKAGNDIWFIYPFLQGLQFAAGMSVLIYGVRQFIAEITAAFVAISEKYIPNSKPAVDCPAIFPFAPTAVLIGFVGAFVGGLAAMAIMIACNSSVIMIPAAGICFFSGGTCGIFGNAYGGWKGALVGSFIVGMALTGLPLILYPAFAGLGISGASFPNVDYNIIGAFLNWILGIFA